MPHERSQPRLTTHSARPAGAASHSRLTPAHAEQGYTVLELVVFSALGLLVLTGVYLLVSAGGREGARTDERLRGVQGVHLFLLNLQDDLSRAVVTSRTPLRVESMAGGRRNRLSFWAYSAKSSTPRRPAVENLSYLFDPDTHRISRNGVPQDLGRFARVEFSRRGETDPLLMVQVSSVAPEALERDPNLSAPHIEASYSLGIGLSYLSQAAANPTWQINPFTVPVPVR